MDVWYGRGRDGDKGASEAGKGVNGLKEFNKKTALGDSFAALAASKWEQLVRSAAFCGNPTGPDV